MTDITAELDALPKMPDPKGNVVGNAFIIERYYALVPRLALAERLLTEAWTQHRLIADMEKSRDDVLTYLEFRKKENQT